MLVICVAACAFAACAFAACAFAASALLCLVSAFAIGIISAVTLLFPIARTVSVLGKHMRVHTGEKPAEVTLCKVYLANAASAFTDVALLLH